MTVLALRTADVGRRSQTVQRRWDNVRGRENFWSVIEGAQVVEPVEENKWDKRFTRKYSPRKWPLNGVCTRVCIEAESNENLPYNETADDSV